VSTKKTKNGIANRRMKREKTPEKVDLPKESGIFKSPYLGVADRFFYFYFFFELTTKNGPCRTSMLTGLRSFAKPGF